MVPRCLAGARELATTPGEEKDHDWVSVCYSALQWLQFWNKNFGNIKASVTFCSLFTLQPLLRGIWWTFLPDRLKPYHNLNIWMKWMKHIWNPKWSLISSQQRPIERGPVKALIFPAEWFDALYPKVRFSFYKWWNLKLLHFRPVWPDPTWHSLVSPPSLHPRSYCQHCLQYFGHLDASTFFGQEYFVMEHDFYVGIGLAIVLTYLVKTQGPAYTAEYVIVINNH